MGISVCRLCWYWQLVTHSRCRAQPQVCICIWFDCHLACWQCFLICDSVIFFFYWRFQRISPSLKNLFKNFSLACLDLQVCVQSQLVRGMTLQEWQYKKGDGKEASRRTGAKGGLLWAVRCTTRSDPTQTLVGGSIPYNTVYFFIHSKGKFTQTGRRLAAYNDSVIVAWQKKKWWAATSYFATVLRLSAFFLTFQSSFQLYCIISCGPFNSYSTHWIIPHWVKDTCVRIDIISANAS